MTSNKKRIRLSEIIGPAFYETHKLIDMGVIDEAVEAGGRASLKSSYVGTELVLQLLKHPDCHALVTRQVGDTMRDSVYAQILWAIDKLGLTTKFKCTQSPLQCTYTPTGQRILFRGLDDPQKIKSIKLPFGYIGILWFEEADQIKGGEDAVRNVQQSALRGGEFGLTFISFNPPAASRNWANRYAREERKGKRVHHSTYLQAPAAWLGPKFLAQAEYIKETQPTKYRHEYLGEVVGSGTQVFENLRLEPISQKTIRNFDTIENGVDWGWYLLKNCEGMVLSMGSYFQDNPPTPEEIAKWRADLTRGWPYTEDDPEPDFFDWTPDPDRSATTDSIYLLKATGNWTAEDERIAFDPSKPPPRPLAELEAEHDAFLKELFKKAKPL